MKNYEGHVPRRMQASLMADKSNTEQADQTAAAADEGLVLITTGRGPASPTV